MAGYTRQSVAEIIAGAVVKAAPINAEYNAIRDAFIHATGHKHDGSTGEGAYIPLISDTDNYNKVVIDSVNDYVVVSVNVSDAAVAQVRFQDGVIFPITDNDIDLGTVANEFKNLYLDGTAKIDTLVVDETATVTGVLTASGGVVGDLTGNVTGTLDGTMTGTVTGTLVGNVNASTGTSIFNNVTINGTATIPGVIIEDIYLGEFSSDPADNNGAPLQTGMLYFNTTDDRLYVYNETEWIIAAQKSTEVLQVANDLSDLNDADTAITNLGITATAAELNTMDGITANTSELNKLDGATVTTTEINYLSGATSNIQTQLDTLDPTRGTLTKSFFAGEQTSINLDQAVSPAPVVTATKEVAQTGVVSKGSWDVLSGGENYEILDSAYSTTLTPVTLGFYLENAVYDSVSFSVAAQYSAPEGLIFNTSGTKMYVVGTGNNVSEYDLATAFDVSTASLSTTFDTSSEANAVIEDLTFKNDGTKMYVLKGSTTRTIFEYDLSVAFDISTASYTGNSFGTITQEATPTGLELSSDGTKLFIVGTNGDEVNEYDLATAFDVSTASFVRLLDLGSTFPNSIRFNADGTKLFVLESDGDVVLEYGLTTGFDTSTASLVRSFSVASEEDVPNGIAFNNDGTKMYIVGSTNDTVFQYSTVKDGVSLGTGSFASTDVGKTIKGNGGTVILADTAGAVETITAFNDTSTIQTGEWTMTSLTFDSTDGVKISAAINGFARMGDWVYDDVSFDTSSQDSNPRGIAFNTDGTKLFVVGIANDSVYEYALTAPFDLSRTTFTASFSVASEEANPNGLAFSNDGTKMFIVGSTGDDVNQYTLSTAFDISTASFSGTTFSIASQETTPEGIAFNNDGTKMYIVGTAGDDINEYALSNPFDLTFVSFTTNLDVSLEEGAPRGLTFNNDGTKMYVIGSAGKGVDEYDLSTGFDISTASYTGNFFSFLRAEPNLNVPYGITFDPTGTKMFVIAWSSSPAISDVLEFSTGTAVSPTSQHHVAVTNVGGQIDSSLWLDINSMTADETLNGGETYYAVSTDDRTTWAVIDDTDGVRPIVRDNSGTWQYNDNSTYGSETWVNATTNNELYALQEALEDGVATETTGFGPTSEWEYDEVSFDTSSEDTSAVGIAFNNDGTKMYIAGNAGDDINEYTLSTAFDITTASFRTNFSIAGQEDQIKGITFNTDGTKMYIVGSTGDDVNEYVLSTAFDVSTASFRTNFSVASEDTLPQGMAFNNDGTKMYILGSTGDDVNEYDLATAFDVSTASYNGTSFSVASEETSPTGLAFNNDGTKLYIIGTASDSVHYYDLATAFDVSTASFTSSFNVSFENAGPQALTFNNDGTKMYILASTDVVLQYSTTLVIQQNRMNSTQLGAVTDPNHYTLGDTLDLAIMLYTEQPYLIPESDGVSISYEAEALNKGAVLGTDYDFDFPENNRVRIQSLKTHNLKVRVV